MEWNQRLQMGVPRIDDEHKYVIDLAGQLSDALDCRDDKVVTVLLEQFCNYFPGHFSEEEKLMEEVGYPDSAGHKTQHGDISAYLAKAKTAPVADGSTVRNTATKVLKWVEAHLEGADLRLADFIRSRT